LNESLHATGLAKRVAEVYGATLRFYTASGQKQTLAIAFEISPKLPLRKHSERASDAAGNLIEESTGGGIP
jgi:hypothetical protein